MRSTWTDSRLDDFKSNVDARFDGLDRRVGDLAGRMDAGFARVDEELRDIRGEIGALQRTVIQVGGGVAGTILVGFLGLIATQI